MNLAPSTKYLVFLPNHACKVPSPKQLCFTSGFWKKNHIKEMQQFAHAFIISHKSSFNQHEEIFLKNYTNFFIISPTTW